MQATCWSFMRIARSTIHSWQHGRSWRSFAKWLTIDNRETYKIVRVFHQKYLMRSPDESSVNQYTGWHSLPFSWEVPHRHLESQDDVFPPQKILCHWLRETCDNNLPSMEQYKSSSDPVDHSFGDGTKTSEERIYQQIHHVWNRWNETLFFKIWINNLLKSNF